MKVAILGDTHFGYTRYEEDSYVQGEEALRSAFERADIVLLAGDIFHHKVPSLGTLARVADIFRNLSKDHTVHDVKCSVIENGTCRQIDWLGLPIAAIHGTHEISGRNITPVKLLERLGFLVDVGGRTVLFEKGEDRVAVTGLGGVAEEFAKKAIEKMDPKPVPNAFNIFMIHQSIRELMYDVAGTFMSIYDLPKGFDLYVNGHIHKPVEWNKDGILLLIPGSTVLTQLKKEEQKPKGYWLFDTDTKDYRFIEICSRPFIYREISVDRDQLSDIEAKLKDTVKDVLEREYKKKPIIRIQLVGRLPKGLTPGDVPSTLPTLDTDRIFHLQIDKNGLESEEFVKSVQQVREMKENNVSVKDFGLRILSERLREQGITLDLNRLFELLLESPDQFYEVFKNLDPNELKTEPSERTVTDVSDNSTVRRSSRNPSQNGQQKLIL